MAVNECDCFVQLQFSSIIHVAYPVGTLLTGLGVEREVNLELGLFEWLGWYLAGVPKFMTSQEFCDAGLPVCVTYTPIWPLSRYSVQETTEQFYDRCYQVTRDILKRHESEGMFVLFVCDLIICISFCVYCLIAD